MLKIHKYVNYVKLSGNVHVHTEGTNGYYADKNITRFNYHMIDLSLLLASVYRLKQLNKVGVIRFSVFFSY